MAERKLTIRMEADTARLRAGMKTASASTRGFGKSIEQGITRHAAGIRRTGMAIAGVGAAMTAVAALSIKAAAEFGAQMAQVSTMLDETSMDLLPQYGESLRAMSKEFGESTKTLSDGLYDILSASIAPTKALGVLDVAARAAAAGITDTGTAADAITTVLNAYQLQAEDAASVSDWLFAVVKRGKCVRGDTRVLLSDGRYERIDSLVEGGEVISWDNRNFVPAHSIFRDMGKKETIWVKTSLGREICTTPEHPYLTPYGWKRVDELKEGERIAVPTSLPIFGNTIPEDGWPELLGYLIAEGSIQRGTPRLAIGNPKIWQKVQDAAERFGIDLRKINQADLNKCPIYDLAINQRGKNKKNPVVEKLKKIGLWGKHCRDKFIPSEVFTWKRKYISLFLEALFNGDGWLCKAKPRGNIQFQLGYCSISKRLVEDVSHLLLRFGIVGHIRKISHNAWTWQTRRYVEIKRFVDFIGIERGTVSSKEFLEYKPVGYTRGRLKNLSSFGKKSREKRTYNPLPSLRNYDSLIYFDQIVKIKQGKVERVYDLTVSQLHNFIANDILAHNTTFQELAPAIGKVATVANMAGVSMEELGAMVATLTRSGVATDRAMTAILGTLRAFLKATDESAETAEIFGVTMNTATLRTEGLRGVMLKLVDAESEQLAQIFPNIRGLLGFSAALGDAEGFAEDLDLMMNRGGLTMEAFDKITRTVSHAFKQLKMEFADVFRALGLELIPIIKKDFIPMMKDIVKRLMEWIKRFGELSPGMKKFLLVLGPILIALGGLLMILPGLAVAIGLLLSPIGLVVAAIAAAVAGFIYLYKTNEKIRDDMDKTVATFIFLGKVIWAFVKGPAKSIWDWAVFLYKNWPEIFLNLFDAITTIFDNFGKNVGKWIGWLGQKLNPKNWLKKIEKPDWTPLLEGFESTMKEFPKIVGMEIGKAVAEYKARLKEIDETTATGMKKVADTVKTGGEEVTDAWRETWAQVERENMEIWDRMRISTVPAWRETFRAIDDETIKWWERMKGFFEGAESDWSTTFRNMERETMSVYERIKNALKPLELDWKATFRSIERETMSVYERIKKALKPVEKDWRDTFKNIERETMAVYERIKKALVPLEKDWRKTFRNIERETMRVYDRIKKALKPLEKDWRTTFRNIERETMGVYQRIRKALQPLEEDWRKTFRNIERETMRVYDRIKKALKPLEKDWRDAFRNMEKATMQVYGTLAKVFEEEKRNRERWSSAVEKTMKFLTSVTKKEQAEQFKDWQKFMADVIGLHFASLPAFQSFWEALTDEQKKGLTEQLENWKSHTNWVRELWKNLEGDLRSGFKSIVTDWLTGTASLADAFRSLGEVIVSSVKNRLLDLIATGITDWIIKFATGIGGSLIPTLAEWGGRMLAIVVQTGKWIAMNIVAAVSAIVPIIGTLVSALGALIITIGSLIAKLVAWIWMSIKAAAAAVFEWFAATIPIVGWILGIAAAALAYAAIKALVGFEKGGLVPSYKAGGIVAQGGEDEGVLVRAHPGELILPKEMADWLRQALARPGPMAQSPGAAAMAGASPSGKTIIVNVPRGAFVVYGDIRTKADVEELVTSTGKFIADDIAVRVAEAD